MRRAVLAVVVTVAGLVALLSFRTHSGTPQAAIQTPAKVPALLAGEHALFGSVVDTVYGPVRVQVVLRAKTIVGVNILLRPGRPEWTCRLASTRSRS